MENLRKNKGILIVISGPSGVGKGTVRKELFKRDSKGFKYSISMTTRKPRDKERNGIDYFFVSREQFEEEIANDGLLEYAEFIDNFYGTPKRWVQEELERGNDVILEIEVEGAKKVRQKMPEGVFIFIAPPSMKALEKRLRKRATEKEEVIKYRLDKAIREVGLAGDYDYIVVNDEIKLAATRIEEIIQAERMRSSRLKDSYLECLKEDMKCL